MRDYLVFPWKQTMREASSFNFIGPLSLVALPLILLVPFKKVRQDPALAILTVVYFLVALHFSGDIRYLLFLLVFFCCQYLSAVGSHR